MEPITTGMNTIELGEKLKPKPVLFQSGYLTVERADRSKKIAEFYLKIPNLEVRGGITPLLFGLKPFINPLQARKNARDMVDALIIRDANGFQKAFGAYLAEYPYELHLPNESFYHSLLLSAFFLADEKLETEVSVGDGKFDAKYTVPNGPMYIFELKYCPLKTPRGEETPESVASKMDDTRKVALEQINDRGYAKNCRGYEHDVYKVPLVVGGRTEILIKFEKEKYA
jgi:hypothetical protein